MPEDPRHRLGPADVGPSFRRSFPDERLLVVSNREPYEHVWAEEAGEVEVRRPAGGLTSALDPLLQAVGGVWVAWGSGDADSDVVDEHDRVRVPPEDPRYTVRRLWLDQRDVRYYYLGYANQFLWPLCHFRPALTRLRERHWVRYQEVNARFAEAVLQEAEGHETAVWFHDYHLALAPAIVRARRPDLKLAHFWHIPWPPLEIFDIAPQARALLEGLVANDLMGFQVAAHARHFMHCAREILGAEVDEDAQTLTYRGRRCVTGAFPISIDVAAIHQILDNPATEQRVARVRTRYAPGGGKLGLGVDRMDYSKGLPERLKALEILWATRPELRGEFTFVQLAVPSRTEIEEYDYLGNTVERMVSEINERFGTDAWRPIHLIHSSLPPERLVPLYRAADLCLVSSLQDGMNLVAKEFVASQRGQKGALLLSRFAGASTELAGAVEVNPYDPEGLAERISATIEMSEEERAARMEQMQGELRTIYEWMCDFVEQWGSAAARVRRA